MFVKARVSQKMSMWRNTHFFHEKHPKKMDTKIWAFSRFTTVNAHFHRMVFVESETQHCFVRRCVSMLQSSAAAKWHCGLCTSIAKILRATVKSRLWEDKLLGM